MDYLKAFERETCKGTGVLDIHRECGWEAACGSAWGIWKNSNFYFETDPNSPKGRNLTKNPRIVFHVQDGMDTVIVEGSLEREKRPGRLRVLKTEYVQKYRYKPDWSDEQHQIVFRAKPRIAHAWKAPRMHRNLVNFIF